MVNFGNIEVKGLYVGNAAAQRACLGGETVWGGEPPVPAEWWGLKFTAVEPDAKFGFYATNEYKSPAVNLEYSVDGGRSWQSLPRRFGYVLDVTLANAGDEAWIRAGSGGNATFAADGSPQFNNHFCTGGGKIAASGSVMSLLDATGQTSSVTARTCFPQLFQYCRQLVTAPDFPSEQVTRECYVSAFQGCRALSTPPALPATTMQNYCYAYMFDGCSSLTAAPELPATTLASNCYNYMFRGCSSLSTPPALPATTLATYCYDHMFQNCTQLTAAPELPATTMQSYCYANMFYNCSKLIDAPALPAGTLASGCYNYMFYNCQALQSAPILSAQTMKSNCYDAMFLGCASLSAAPALPATTLAGGCYSAMFANCNSLISAPELPAYSLANSCYWQMFAQCEHLQKAPYLRSTQIGTDRYAYMFDGCSILNDLSAGFTDWTDSTKEWLKNTAQTGDFYCPSRLGNDSTMTRDVSCVPEGWTVHNPTWIRYTDDNTSLNWVTGKIGRTDFEAALARDGKTSADIYAVDFGQDVTAIGPSCFADWGSLRDVKIGDNVQTVGENAFRRRQSLSSVQWGYGSNLTAIGPYGFAGVQRCGRHDLPDGLQTIGANAFGFGGNLSVVTVPSSVTHIGGGAFSNNSNLLSVIFHGKTMAEVEAMTSYPWGASGKIFVD